MAEIKRDYEAPSSKDGIRTLVDRLWARGVTKVAFDLEGWVKGGSPGDELRERLPNNPSLWSEFRRLFFAELEQSRAAWEPIHEAARKGTGTLVYAAQDTVANTALGLKQFLDERHNQVPSESFP
jgi:uncharacterized protein YeaO (DUF488 family)